MNNQAYLGTQDQGDDVSDFNARDFHIREVLEQSVRLGLPALVVRAPYDASGNAITPGTVGPSGFIDVQPMVSQLDGYGNATPHGTVYRISYYRNQSGNAAYINDPVKGDIGHIVVNDRDISSAMATSKAANPGSRRKFDFADSIFYGSPRGGTPTQYDTWFAQGFEKKDGFGNLIQGTAQGVIINGCLINQQGDVITKHGTDLNTHVHTLTEPGTGESGPPP